MRFMPRIDEYWSFYSWFLLGLGLVFHVDALEVLPGRHAKWDETEQAARA
jgi:hypothetical protein